MKRGEIWTLQDRNYASKARPVVVIQSDSHNAFDSVILCLFACEYCHGKGHGKCVQKDDMQTIYTELRDTEMLVLAAPIYYHGIR